MLKLLKLTRSPLTSLFILMLGSGLINTLTTVRLHTNSSPALLIGAMTTVYYLGLVLASFGVERAIFRVGHIRAFAAFAALLAVTSLLQGMFFLPWFWLVLRFISGFATAGLFVVIESWLLLLGTINSRGQILASYMIVLYAGQSCAQFFINLPHESNLFLFAIVTLFITLSIIPVALTRISSPTFEQPSSLSFKKLYQKSASGIVGCLGAGLMLGAIYGLFPLFVAKKVANTSSVSLFMALVIIGGMSLQYPLGKLSDYLERRTVLIGIACATIGISLLMIMAFHWFWLSIFCTLLFGGFTFTFYPVAISYACDSLNSEDIVAGAQGLLLAYGIGASVGPMVGAAFIREIGASGLFVYIIAISSVLTVFFLWKRIRVEAIPQEDNFRVLTQTTPLLVELDPRGNTDLEMNQENNKKKVADFEYANNK